MIRRKKNILLSLLVIALTALCGLTACQTAAGAGQIYLYGETHSVPAVLDREFELWNEYYHEEGMRYLFVEEPYYSAEFLNLWMQEDNDELLDAQWREIRGTAGGTSIAKDFYRKIKQECPETIFCGTDIGHQYDTTGERYLEYLKEHGQEDSANYQRAQEVMEQGEAYYGKTGIDAEEYRENMMVQNFVWELNRLDGENIMGIYGDRHTGLDEGRYGVGSVQNMACQLREKYPENFHVKDLTKEYKSFLPWEEKELEINGRQYQAALWGEVPAGIEGKSYNYVKVWELEEGAEDFKGLPAGEKKILESSLPGIAGSGKVYVLDFYTEDEFGERRIFRSDEKEQDDGERMVREILCQ